MSYNASVQSQTTLNTTSAEGITFNFPLFITANQYFFDRTKIFGSWTEVMDDTSIPKDSNTFAGLKTAFSQPKAPSRVYVGRREVDLLTLTPSPVIDNKDYKVTFVVKDDATQTSVTTVVSVNAGTGADATSIATALFGLITSNVANVTEVDAGGTVTVVPEAGYQFIIKGMDKVVDSYTATETAAEVFAAIQEEENNFYFVTAEDHSEVFILGLAAVIEPTASTDFPKMYFTSTADANSLVPLPDPAIDVIGKLKELNYQQTVCDWHHQADTIFPEMAIIAAKATAQAGATTWKFTQLKAVPAAADLVTGKRLSQAKQGYIEDRNGNWIGREKGVDIYKEGKTVGGEWIDIIRFKDWLNNETEVTLFNLLLNAPNGKIPQTVKGRGLVANAVDGVYDTAVGFGALSGYEQTTVPAEADISFANKAGRILDQVNSTGYLSGAIHTIITNGNLTYPDSTI